MKMMLIVLCVLCFGCRFTKDFVLEERDLIPEGTAYHARSKSILIGSTFKQKVISISQDGIVKIVVDKEELDDLSPVGMEVDEKRNILWLNLALYPMVNQTNKSYWESKVVAIDMEDGRMINKYDVHDHKEVFFNDLTLDSKGNVYITETVNGLIYKIDKATYQISKFVDLLGYSFPNGIVFDDRFNCLFIATNEGIVKLNVDTKHFSLVKCHNGVNAASIDGLSIHKNYFIGHQSKKISKFYFNDVASSILKSEILDSGKNFDSSTTGDVSKGFYFYIVNSQIKSGFDQSLNKIKPLDSLEKVIVRRKKL
jgi:hypothetical protein